MRLCVGRNLHQVHPLLLSQMESVTCGHYRGFNAITYDAYLTYTNLFVYPILLLCVVFLH